MKKQLKKLGSLPANLLACKRCGFTLAEVLITLGVIGVVAALTMPIIVHNYQKKALETQFKKAVRVSNQIIERARVEMGIDKFGSYCTTYIPGNGYINAHECNKTLQDVLHNNLNSKKQGDTYLGQKEYVFNRNQYMGGKFMPKNFLGGTLGYTGSGQNSINVPHLELDGSLIGYTLNEHIFFWCIDTNGLKGPNKLGYDVFQFFVANNTIKRSQPSDNSKCSKDSSDATNGITCSYYAQRDECPDNPTKGYWECLP